MTKFRPFRTREGSIGRFSWKLIIPTSALQATNLLEIPNSEIRLINEVEGDKFWQESSDVCHGEGGAQNLILEPRMNEAEIEPKADHETT